MTAFAKLTGDISVLSEADIRVLALTYALEVEQNGLRRIREAPGKLSPEEQEREDKKQERMAKLKQEKTEDHLHKQVSDLSLQEPAAEGQPEASTSALPPAIEGSPAAITEESATEFEEQEQEHEEEEEDFEDVPTTQNEQAVSEGEEEESDGDGEWITPSNVTLHKSRDLGLFPSLPSHHPENVLSKSAQKAKQKTILKVACLTGDFAMQNVALQMGLNVFGVGGQKIREVKTWVLRCHACFK